MTDYSADIIDFQSQSKAKVNPVVPPGQAQAAVKMGQPDLLHSVPLQAQAGAQENANIVARSPHMSRWVNDTHPAHVAASTDHFPWMEGMGDVFNLVKGMVYTPPGPERGKSHAPEFMRHLPGGDVTSTLLGGEAFGETAKQAKEGFDAAFGPSQVGHGGAIGSWLTRMDPEYGGAFVSGLDIANRAMGLAQDAASPILGPASAAVRPIEGLTGINRQAIPQIAGALAGLGGKFVKKAPGAAGEGGSPAPTATTSAPHPADIMESLGHAVQSHPLTKAAPDTMKEFLHQQVEGSPMETVKISGTAVKRAYDAAGIEPHPNDGIMGWVPDLHKQLNLALQTGGDIEVPLKDYITNADSNAQNQMAGGIRYNDEATRDEEQSQQPSAAKSEAKLTPAPLTKGGMMENYQNKTEQVPIDWIKKNIPAYNELGKTDVDALSKDITEKGLREPVIINVGKNSRTATIGEGNHRIAAAEKAGYTHIPARVIVGQEWGKGKGGPDISSDLIPQKDEYFSADAKPSQVFRSLEGKAVSLDESEGKDQQYAGAYDHTEPSDHLTVYHGTNQRFDKFNLANAEKGAGGTEAGHGIYTTSDQKIGQAYAESVAKRLGGEPHNYELHIPATDTYLDFQKPLKDQSPTVQDALRKANGDRWFEARKDKTGEDAFRDMHLLDKNNVAASEKLSKAGVTGTVRAGSGGKHYILFKPEDAKIASINGEAQGTAATLASIPKEVRAIAAEESKKYWLKGLFDKAKTFNMSEPQAKAYSKLIAARLDNLAEKLKAEVGRQQKVVTKELIEKHLPEVRKELEQVPEIAARHVQKYGRLPSEAEPSAMFKDLDADSLAELFGFDNAAAMNKAIEPLEAHRKGTKDSVETHFERLVKAEATRRASEEAQTLSPAKIEDITRDALAGEHGRVILIKEMNILADEARKAGKSIPPFTKADIAARAAKSFDGIPVSQARNVKYWERLAFRNGREAEYQGIKGDAKGAFEAKQQQTLTTHMLERSHAFKAFSQAAYTRWKSWAGNTTMSSIEQPWLDQMHSVLSDMGFSVARDPVELQKALALRPNFIADQQLRGAEVFQWPVPKGVPIKNWTVEDYTGVANMLKSYAHNGNEGARLAKYLAKMEYEDIINGIRDKVADRGDKAMTQAQVAKRAAEPGIKGALHDLRGSAWAPPFMMDRLDGMDPFGPWHRALDQPIQKGTGWKADKLAEIGDKIRKLEKSEPKGWKKRLTESIDSGITIVHEDDTPSRPSRTSYVTDRGELIMNALQYGSESGRAKLLKGTKTDEATWQALFDKYLDDPYDRQVIKHFGDVFDDLWTHTEALSRRKSGVAPTALKKAPFKINGEDMPGSYTWAKYDYQLATEEQRSHAPTAGDPFDLPNYQRATPPHGYVKERTEFAAPFDLDIDNLHHRIGQIVHDIAFREPVALAAKILSDPAARMAIEKVLGPEYPKQFDNYISRVANAQAFDARALQGLNGIAKASRWTMAMVQLALRPVTAIKHLTAAWTKSSDELGGGTIARASREFWIHPIQVSKSVRAESSFMRHRFETNERDIAGKVSRLFEKQGYIGKGQQFGFALVGASDWISAVPTYTAARDAALLRGESMEDAIYLGERAVRRAHGSGTPADLSAIMDPRGENAEIVKTLSTFMTFFHNTLQRMYELPERNASGIIAGLTYLWLIPAIGEFLVMGRLKDDSDTWAKSALEALTLVATGGMPVIRPMAETVVPALIEGHKPDIYHLIAQEDIIGSWAKNIANVSNAVTGNPVSKTWVKDAIEGIGYARAIPGAGWAAQVGQYLYDNYEGQVPDGTSPLSGMFFGEHSRRK
jgi:hypothetical protein